MRRRPVLVGVAVVALVAAVVGGLLVLRARERAEDRRLATAVAAQWLQAWQDARYADVDPLTAGDDAPSGALQRTDERLRVTAKTLVPGPLAEGGDDAAFTVPYTATAQLRELGEFSWSSRLRLVERGDDWRVAFDAATVHPRLVNGQRLDRESRPAPRAPVLDRQGRPVRPASADLAANVLGRPPREGVDPTGLERVLDDRLAGRAAGAVVLADAASGQRVEVLQEYAGSTPTPVRTTLDLTVQAAAESALSGLTAPAGLVAIDSATGQVRAAASRPVVGQPRAFTSYAPGSVFKVVTAAALLEDGLRPTSEVDCPPTYRGTGNASSVRPGRMTLTDAFAQSCNTTFLQLADELPDGALARTAAAFGFGQSPLLPIAAESGSFPTGGGPADATAAIGQGRVEASPLLMATVLAAVESGTWRQPSLVPDQPDLVARPLPPDVAAGLRTMLRAVVERGTGSAADLPGAPVSGKTGSAEIGSGDEVHVWFAGYRAGLAFCVFAERGESGGGTAAPVARRFLAALS